MTMNNADFHLKQILDASIPLLIIKKDFTMQMVNKTYCTYFNEKEKDILGGKCYEIYQGPFCNTPQCAMEQIMSGKEQYEYEWEETSPDGRKAVFLVRAVPYRSADGNIMGIIENFTDITAQVAAKEALQESESRLSGILSSMTDFVFAFDADGRFIFYHAPRVEDLYVPPDQFIGKKHSEVLPKHVNMRLEKALKKNKKREPAEYEYNLHIGGKTRWFSAKISPVFLEDQYKGSVSVIREITHRKNAEDKIKKSLREKEVLLKEIHHRVKNNMQIISSLLRLQSRHIEDKQAKKMFADSRSRIKAMALIHERLYRSEDLAAIDFSEYVRILTRHLFGMYGNEERKQKIHLDIDVSGILLDINTAIPCALIVNELVTNALKYAFQEDRPGEISISLSPVPGNRIKLRISDNGIGFPENIDYSKTESFGMQLVMTLVAQIEGSIHLNRSHGTAFEIDFPKPAAMNHIE